jgi:hypothetical protein
MSPTVIEIERKDVVGPTTPISRNIGCQLPQTWRSSPSYPEWALLPQCVVTTTKQCSAVHAIADGALQFPPLNPAEEVIVRDELMSHVSGP